MRKECRVTVTILSSSENTGDIFYMKSLKIDPAYLSWVAYKFIPKIPKQERFVKIAQAYHSIHLDIMIRKIEGEAFIQPLSGRIRRKADRLKIKSHPGKIGRRSVQNKSERHYPTVFVKQVLTLTDASGNLVTMSIPSKIPVRFHALYPG